MMNRPRLKASPSKGKSAIRTAQNHDEWHRLMQSAIEMAEKSGDSRIHGLRAAHAEGRVEQHLRKLGIICPNDLHREFPPPPKT